MMKKNMMHCKWEDMVLYEVKDFNCVCYKVVYLLKRC